MPFDRKAYMKEYNRAWYRKNKAKCDARNKAWCEANRPRRKIHARQYQQRNSEGTRAERIERLYGLTADGYNTLLATQEGVCAICKRPPRGKRKPLCVDHCHKSGAVRGLLCHQCNMAIGLLGDNLHLVLAAAEYIRGEL